MELSRQTIGSLRSFEKARRKAAYWKLADVLMIVWAVSLVLLVPFIAGFVVGGAVNENVSDWAQSESRRRKSEQGDKWSFCLTAGTLWPANQERP